MIYTGPKMHIDLNHLADNYRALKKMAPSSVAAGVVKNDAYGLGAVFVAKRLYHEGCRHFFVAHASEGAQIRPHVKNSDIYVLQGCGADSVDIFKTAHLTPVISTAGQLRFWQQNATPDIRPIIQVETGLNRLGLNLSQAAALTNGQKKSFSYVLSHLACADEPAHLMNERQRRAFEAVKTFFPDTPATLSATDGAFLGKAYHFDMVRFGAGLYGLNPFHPASLSPVGQGQKTSPKNTGGQQGITLKAVLYISAPILRVADLKAGDYVGYGATYQAQKDMKIATVSIGYGDGLPRSLSNTGCVRINGQNAPIIGRVSMDNIMCDVSGIDTVQEGNYAAVLDDVYTADDMAAHAGTIGYEILSNLGKGGRFCKSYIG